MTKSRFTDEFKREAVALWETSGKPQTESAGKLGIMPTRLRRWQRQVAEVRPAREPCGEAASCSGPPERARRIPENMMTEVATDDTDLLILTAEIVAAHLEKNRVEASQLPAFIAWVHDPLFYLGKEEPASVQGAAEAFDRRSRQHQAGGPGVDEQRQALETEAAPRRHSHTPDSYRKAYDLPADYPMVSRAYCEKRSAISMASGFALKPKGPVAAPAQGRGRSKFKLAIDAAKGHLGES